MAEYDKEEAMAIQSNALPPLVSLSVVNKQIDPTANDSSASSKSELANSERLLASLRIEIEPQSLGHVGILDLADELLMNIFGHATDSADIRNIRLTCRRFCSTSSHLLLDCLDVCLTSASLARAQEISCHPTISKGIRALHISLQSNRHLGNISRFTSLAIEYLQRKIGLVLMNPQKALENGNFVSWAEFEPILMERQRLLHSWFQYRETRKYSTRQQSLDVEILHRCYEKYRMEYEWQRRTIQDGTFAQAIAAAVGRIPRATTLLFTDKFRYRESFPIFHANKWRRHISASDVLDDRMMLSIGESLWPVVMTTKLAVQVPLAIHSAGSSTIQIGIHLPTQPDDSTWIHNQAQLLGLKAAAESLRVFAFQARMKDPSPPEDISSALTYLRVVLGAANLQVLTLSVPSYTLDEYVGPLLASFHWPHLRKLNLVRVALHLSDLKTFVGEFRPGIFLNLKQIRLRSGSWAEGLDVLRSKANSESQVGPLSGAECDPMVSDQLRRILDGGQASWASQYIQGVSNRNPFLVTEDETADEETNPSAI